MNFGQQLIQCFIHEKLNYANELADLELGLECFVITDIVHYTFILRFVKVAHAPESA